MTRKFFTDISEILEQYCIWVHYFFAKWFSIMNPSKYFSCKNNNWRGHDRGKLSYIYFTITITSIQLAQSVNISKHSVKNFRKSNLLHWSIKTALFNISKAMNQVLSNFVLNKLTPFRLIPEICSWTCSFLQCRWFDGRVDPHNQSWCILGYSLMNILHINVLLPANALIHGGKQLSSYQFNFAIYLEVNWW